MPRHARIQRLTRTVDSARQRRGALYYDAPWQWANANAIDSPRCGWATELPTADRAQNVCRTLAPYGEPPVVFKKTARWLGVRIRASLGVIPDGPSEGVLRLAVDATDPGGRCSGDDAPCRAGVTCRTKRSLCVSSSTSCTRRTAAPLRFVRTADISNALAHVAVIGHRGLSLENRIEP
jgi:hypothetical protein